MMCSHKESDRGFYPLTRLTPTAFWCRTNSLAIIRIKVSMNDITERILQKPNPLGAVKKDFVCFEVSRGHIRCRGPLKLCLGDDQSLIRTYKEKL